MITREHEHRIEGAPIRMTPTTKPNLAWRCLCGWFTFVRLERGPNGEHTWHPPASDETIRLKWLEAINA